MDKEEQTERIAKLRAETKVLELQAEKERNEINRLEREEVAAVAFSQRLSQLHWFIPSSTNFLKAVVGGVVLAVAFSILFQPILNVIREVTQKESQLAALEVDIEQQENVRLTAQLGRLNTELRQLRDASEKVEANRANVDQAKINLLRDYQNRVREAGDLTFEEFEASVFREPDGGKYIVDGDTPIDDRKHLEEFFDTKVKQLHRPDRRMGELIVNTSGGVDTVWDDTQKLNLSYCVSRGFGTHYDAVVDAMENAASAWQGAADINFVHDTSHDSNCTAVNSQVLFDVRPVSRVSYLARAFFPDDSRASRNVLIADSSFTLDPSGALSLVGILRHQLGHILGFRHEYTRPNAGPCFEDTNWRPLTDYDEFSTMNYPQCNGAGDWSLALTASDKTGVACLYGAAQGFTIDSNICFSPVRSKIPPNTRAPQVVMESGSVDLRQIVQVGDYDVAPGTEFNVEMVGSGDPDLYVRFDNPPSVSSYNCRPYRTGATEACNLTVPVGVAKGFVMVRGYRTGTYHLTIEHTLNP